MDSERDRVNAFGQELKKIREHNGSTIISFEVVPEDYDSCEDYFRVVVGDGIREAMGSGLYLYDAIHMANAHLERDQKKANEINDQISVAKVPVTVQPTPQIKPRISGAGLLKKGNEGSPVIKKKLIIKR